MPATDRGSTRVTPLWLLAIAGILLVARVALGIADHISPAVPPSLVEWRDERGAANEARGRRVPLLYVFVREGHKPSQSMEADLFANPQIASSLNRSFVPVRVVDAARKVKVQVAKDLAERYGVKDRPALVVADPASDRFDVLNGYPGRMEAMQWLAMAPVGLGLSNPLGGAVRMGSPLDSSGAARPDSVLSH